MGWKDKLTEATSSLPGLTDLLSGKINELLDEYKAAVEQLETFGFTVDTFSVEMRLPPSAHTSIRGSIASIQVERVRKLIDEKKDNAVLTSALNALLTAKRIHDQVDLKLESIILDVTLGVPPSVGIRFGKHSADLTPIV